MTGKKDTRSEALLELSRAKLESQYISASISHGHVVIELAKENMLDFFKLLKLDTELDMDMFVSVTAVDWMDERDERFEVVYHLTSSRHHHRMRIKIQVPEEDPSVFSLVGLWAGADFMEREVYDMYGVRFENHPDLRRILMYDEFEGYPLRKDYPVQAKQPRIPLRHPEVENTARLMNRSDLVQIGSKPASQIKPAATMQRGQNGQR